MSDVRQRSGKATQRSGDAPQRSESAKQPVDDRDPADPSPAEIRRRSETIRRSWSERVTIRRRVYQGPHWRPPLVFTLEVVRQMNEQQEY